jgi:hypothetical protein
MVGLFLLAANPQQNKAAIPLKEKKKRLDQLIHLYERWHSLKKNIAFSTPETK